MKDGDKRPIAVWRRASRPPRGGPEAKCDRRVSFGFSSRADADGTTIIVEMIDCRRRGASAVTESMAPAMRVRSRCVSMPEPRAPHMPSWIFPAGTPPDTAAGNCTFTNGGQMNLHTALCAGALSCVAAAVVGCASTSTEFNAIWVNPEAVNRAPVKSVLVVAINRDPTARRIYEDTMVTQLAQRGIKAQPSYKVLPGEAPPPPPVVEATVRQAGVDSLLVSRVMRETTDIRVTPGHAYGPAGFAGLWAGASSVPPNVYTVQKVVVDTRLLDAKDFVVLWSATSTTEPTPSMEKTIVDFSGTLIRALGDAKVL